MLIASKLISQGRGLAPAIVRRAATVELDWDTRQKSRFDAVDSTGRAVGVFMPRGAIVRGGDVLVAEDGSLIVVRALAQPMLVVRPRAEGTPLDLLRAAYHLGNRHVPLQVCADRLQLEPDHVLADLMRRMGLDVGEETAPFEPEAGAYAAASQSHAHAHAHAHGSRPEHARPHGESPAAAAEPAHVHGPGCGHANR